METASTASEDPDEDLEEDGEDSDDEEDNDSDNEEETLGKKKCLRKVGPVGANYCVVFGMFLRHIVRPLFA